MGLQPVFAKYITPYSPEYHPWIRGAVRIGAIPEQQEARRRAGSTRIPGPNSFALDSLPGLSRGHHSSPCPRWWPFSPACGGNGDPGEAPSSSTPGPAPRGHRRRNRGYGAAPRPGHHYTTGGRERRAHPHPWRSVHPRAGCHRGRRQRREGEYISVSVGLMGHSCALKSDAPSSAGAGTSTARPRRPEGTFASRQRRRGPHLRGEGRTVRVTCWGFDEDGRATPPRGEFASSAAGGCILRGEDGRVG